MMTNENIEDTLNNEGMPVPNVWVELEGEFLDFDHKHVLQHESLFLVALSLQT